MTIGTGFASAGGPCRGGRSPMSIGHGLHRSQRPGMFATPVLIHLGLMTSGANIRSCNLDIVHIVDRRVVGAVTIDAPYVHLTVLALFPLGDHLRIALAMAIHTLRVSCRRLGRRMRRLSRGLRRRSLLPLGRTCGLRRRALGGLCQNKASGEKSNNK